VSLRSRRRRGSSPPRSPDATGPSGTSLHSLGPIPIGLGAAIDLFCAAKAAEGASPRTVEWYRMILVRAVRQFGEARPVDAIPPAELRAWLLELRSSLAPESIAGYVRGLKAFGNWCAAEEVAAASGFRPLRRPKVPLSIVTVDGIRSCGLVVSHISPRLNARVRRQPSTRPRAAGAQRGI
jgi:hypothetical protein